VHNIGIKGPKDGFGPKQVKLFINRHSFGFSDADSVPCAQQLDLTDKDLDGEPIALKLTKVRRHTQLTAQGLACQQGSCGSAAAGPLMQSTRSVRVSQRRCLGPMAAAGAVNAAHYSWDPQALCSWMPEQSVLVVCDCCMCVLLLQFSSVTTLHILIESNQGDEETTKLFKINLGGVAFDSFNVAEIKKVEDAS
jgi:hypothetical protein